MPIVKTIVQSRPATTPLINTAAKRLAPARQSQKERENLQLYASVRQFDTFPNITRTPLIKNITERAKI